MYEFTYDTNLAAGMTESSFCLHLALMISGTTW